MIELDAATAPAAADLRARHRSLPLPDALVLATATRRSVDELITTDRTRPAARQLARNFEVTLL